MANVNIRPTFKLPYLESDSNRPTMTFKLTYYDIQTVLLGRSHLRQTRVCLRWKLNFRPTVGAAMDAAYEVPGGGWRLPASNDSYSKWLSKNLKKHHAKLRAKVTATTKKVIKHKGKQIQGKFSRSAKAKARMRELLADDAVKKEAASTDLDSHSSTILCVLVPLMVAIAAASATMTGTLGH